MSDLLDVPATLAYLGGIGRSTLYRIVKKGEIRTLNFEGRTYVPKAELERYLEANEVAWYGPPDPPLPHRFTLYRFFDADGALLYVGITGIGAARWTHHSKYQPWWPEVATIKVEHFPTLEAVAAAEVAAIVAELPRYNVVHKPR